MAPGDVLLRVNERDIKLVDDEGKPIQPGETGNLLVKGIPGLSIFAEYFNDPAATEAAFDDNGYFKTGDRLTLHEDGFISFSERARDLIKVGGEGVGGVDRHLHFRETHRRHMGRAARIEGVARDIELDIVAALADR